MLKEIIIILHRWNNARYWKVSCNDIVEYLCLNLLTFVIDNSFNAGKWKLTELTTRSANLILLASGVMRYQYTCTSIPHALAAMYVVACSSAFLRFLAFCVFGHFFLSFSRAIFFLLAIVFSILAFWRVLAVFSKHSFQRRRSISKRGGGAHLSLSHAHTLTQIFQNALCIVPWHKQTSLQSS